jgi:hypothetical protein
MTLSRYETRCRLRSNIIFCIRARQNSALLVGLREEVDRWHSPIFFMMVVLSTHEVAKLPLESGRHLYQAHFPLLA